MISQKQSSSSAQQRMPASQPATHWRARWKNISRLQQDRHPKTSPINDNRESIISQQEAKAMQLQSLAYRLL
jgi:hypothetical protein